MLPQLRSKAFVRLTAIHWCNRMTYLSPRALQGLKQYQYKSGGYTLLDDIHQPFWNGDQLPILDCHARSIKICRIFWENLLLLPSVCRHRQSSAFVAGAESNHVDRHICSGGGICYYLVLSPRHCRYTTEQCTVNRYASMQAWRPLVFMLQAMHHAGYIISMVSLFSGICISTV